MNHAVALDADQRAQLPAERVVAEERLQPFGHAAGGFFVVGIIFNYRVQIKDLFVAVRRKLCRRKSDDDFLS